MDVFYMNIILRYIYKVEKCYLFRKDIYVASYIYSGGHGRDKKFL